MKRARFAAFAALAGLCACPKPTDPPSTTTPPPDSGATEGESQLDTANTEGTCGPEGLAFEDLAFVPLDVRMVSLRQRGPELDAATKAVSSLPGMEGVDPFPILVNMEFQGMWLEGVVLESVLETFHLDPAQLLEMHDPKGASVWVVPTECDIGVLKGYGDEAYGLTFRDGPSASIGASPDAETFPFDVVLFTNSFALAPAGRGGRVVDWFGSGGQAGALGEPDKRPGERLLELEHAPVRVLVRGQALVAGDEDPSTKEARTVRAGPDFLEVDGTPIE